VQAASGLSTLKDIFMQQITNREFLIGIYGALAPKEVGWINEHEGNPKEYQKKGEGGKFWKGKRIHHADDCPIDCGDKNAYYSIASVREVDRTYKRDVEHFFRQYLVLLDDIREELPFVPSYRLETSPGNAQVGMILAEPIEDPAVSKRLQDALAKKQGLIANDKNGNNPVRYARLPCGSNGKYDPPYRTRLVEWNPERKFTLKEVCDYLGLDINEILGIKADKPFNAPVSNINSLAMQNLSLWVTKVFPQAKESNGNYRVDSQSLGRDLEEDIGIHKNGIKDFGISDQGDPRGGKRTPVELVAEHYFGDISKQLEAEQWLRELLTDEVVDSTELALLRAGTEHSIALAFKQKYAGLLRFNQTTQNWLQWDGKCWMLDALHRAAYYCRDIATSRSEAKAAQKHSFHKAVENIARNDPAFSTVSSAFDVDNYLLNTPDGVFDLRTGRRLAHDPALLLSKITKVSAAMDYGVRFIRFLDEITCGDKQMALFLQVALGACLSGAIESHWMMFWIGSGRNGKNTLGDAIMKILGDYAKKIPARVLMSSKTEGHPTEIAQLWGARLAVGSEVEQTAFWSESKLNELTGDQTIAGRFIGGDWFNFPKTWKFLIFGNHRPRLNSITPAVKARIKIVRFNADFSENGDPDLPAKLEAEYPNILRWLLDGHQEWLRLGKKLPQCDAVDAELEDYMQSQATVENWATQCLKTCDEWQTASGLYNGYKMWKEDRGENPVSQVVWAENMKKMFAFKRTNVAVMYQAQLTTDGLKSSVFGNIKLPKS
jgi:putative DNA primase/helicase